MLLSRPAQAWAAGPQRGLRVHASANQAAAGPRPSSSEAEALKTQIKMAVAGTNRGKNSTVDQRRSINAKIMDLESLNPTRERPALFVDGWWNLLYQGKWLYLEGCHEKPAAALWVVAWVVAKPKPPPTFRSSCKGGCNQASYST